MRFVMAALGLSVSLFAQTPPVFKVDASYIKVPVTAMDEKGRLLVDLTREYFEVFDEGEPRSVENCVLDRTPLHVMLLLDVSGSVREEIEEIKDAAVDFAQAFDRDDRVAAISFADRMVSLQGWTNDVKKLRKSLRKLEPGYRTALYDALLTTSRERLHRVPGKRVIILLTDGLDNESRVGFDAVIDGLIGSDISLYIVSRTRLVLPEVQKTERVRFLNQVMKNLLEEDRDFVQTWFREKETAMRYLSEATGGRALFPEKLSELSGSYAQVAQELKTQYVLTFRPPASSDKRFRSIQVSCKRPTAHLYYRRQYSWDRRPAAN